MCDLLFFSKKKNIKSKQKSVKIRLLHLDFPFNNASWKSGSVLISCPGSRSYYDGRLNLVVVSMYLLCVEECFRAISLICSPLCDERAVNNLVIPAQRSNIRYQSVILTTWIRYHVLHSLVFDHHSRYISIEITVSNFLSKFLIEQGRVLFFFRIVVSGLSLIRFNCSCLKIASR